MNVVLLVMLLVLFILISAFFSSSETAMMALNRYRLRHEAREGNAAAKRVSYLLQRPDRLLGMILSGNTFANILASTIATLLSVQYLKEVGAVIASIVLTFVVLIFAEVAPKTVAAAHAQRYAYWVSRPLIFLLRLLDPVIFLVNMTANGFLRLFGFKVSAVKEADALSHEELRSVVRDAEKRLPAEYSAMLLGLLDLKKLSINDTMVVRSDIVGIDISQPWSRVLQELMETHYTRLPVYREDIDHVCGILHMRDVAHLLVEGRLTEETLLLHVQEPYFIPEATPLYTQLLQFQKSKQRIALVVDEYGDIQGLVTLDDILEEIVGEFTTDAADQSPLVTPSENGYLVDGDVTVRELNRLMHWQLPVNGPKTLSGLIIDEMELIPRAQTSIQIKQYRIHVLQVKHNKIEKVCISEAK